MKKELTTGFLLLVLQLVGIGYLFVNLQNIKGNPVWFGCIILIILLLTVVSFLIARDELKSWGPSSTVVLVSFIFLQIFSVVIGFFCTIGLWIVIQSILY